MDMVNVFPICKEGSIYSLGYDYIQYCFGDKVSSKQKEAILDFFSRLLDSWCLEDIYKELNVIANLGDECIISKDYISNHFKNKKPPKINLLKRNDYRTHKEVQLISKAPVIDFNAEVLDIKSITSENYLEPRASYSMDDLIGYVMKQKRYILTEVNSINRMKSCLSHILNGCEGLDGAINVILYSFDDAIRNCKRKGVKMKDMFEIQNHMEYGIDTHKRLVDRQKFGDIKFVPKKRMLFDRSGLLEKQRSKTV